jgi:hypothetical protein
MSYTLADAAQATSLNRSTLLRAIKSGCQPEKCDGGQSGDGTEAIRSMATKTSAGVCLEIGCD